MLLAKQYRKDLHMFLQFLPNIVSQIVVNANSDEPDAIGIGTRQAGLGATLNILDHRGKVVLIKKEHHMGGNSNKASSGICAGCRKTPLMETSLTVLEMTLHDQVSAWLELIDTLVSNSESAVQWLKEHVGVDLSILSQLGGHRYNRMHCPQSGMVGAEIIYNIQRAVKGYEKLGMVQIFMDIRVTSLKK
ncbi:LOW QUALITY PROTEIN: hypothetical protein ACHAW6_001374 [Cyclotella cf. meneghiniana]